MPRANRDAESDGLNADNAIADGNSGAGADGEIASSVGSDANAIDADAAANGDAGARTTAEPPQKRRGGWPKGKPRKPADGTASAATGTASRPGNARNAERVDREKTGVLAQQIVAFHQIAAMATSIPELMIDEREAGLLATSIRELSAHYGPVVSGPAMLWVQFVGVAAMIYVPRVPQVALRLAAIRAERQNEAREQARPRGDNVVDGDFSRARDDDPFAPGKVGG